MMNNPTRVTAGVCLVLGPVLQAAATFYWQDGRQGVDAATLIVLSTAAWLLGLIGVFRSVENRLPRYAAVGLPVALYGALSGVSFAVQGMHEELFGVSHQQAVDLLNQHPWQARIVFWIAGPLFPISLFVLGIALARIRAVPLWAGALVCLGALAFPLSRIPREATVAHLADLLLLLPFAYLGVRLALTGLTPGASGSGSPDRRDPAAVDPPPGDAEHLLGPHRAELPRVGTDRGVVA